MHNDFRQLVEDSQKILITSHTSPDPDAVASLLLLGTTLELNYPNKQIQMVLEEEPDSLDFLTGYEKINFELLGKSIEEFQPNLFVMVDANGAGRVSRRDGQKINELLSAKGIQTAIIDHHVPDDKDETDIYINSGNPAAAQEVYELCFDQLGLKKPEGYAQTTMLGLYADSGGFAYQNPRFRQTLALAADLVDAGANIEQIKNHINQYSEEGMSVIAELAVNLSHEADYTYSYLGDDFVTTWVQNGKSLPALHSSRKKFVNDYIRSIDGRQWGFVISLDPQEEERVYSVSLRSVGGGKDVAAIAKKLDGGGHKASAGGKIQAASVEEALHKVKEVIAQSD